MRIRSIPMADKVVGPYKKAACFTLLCKNQISLTH